MSSAWCLALALGVSPWSAAVAADRQGETSFRSSSGGATAELRVATSARGPVAEGVPIILTVADRLILTVTPTAPPGYRFEKIAWQGELGETWREAAGPEQRGNDTTLIVEPFLPGAFILPALSVRFVAEPADAGREPIVLELGPLRGEVLSVLPAGTPRRDLTDIRPVVEPPPPPRDWTRTIVIGAVAASAVVLAGALVPLVARLARRRPPPPPAPHEVALSALNRLESSDLLARGLHKPFFQAASDILRRYIEDRFALRAPERTTDEFLREARDASPILPGDVERLEDFLRHADLVKFAEQTPSRETSARTVSLIRDFVQRTTPTQAPASPAP
ncbi:MAG: hypothetical protein IBJ11_01675 [Phycisphaerales bacterium]|nr:hypothetical protein [Phycisphaerales bacterium]